MGGGRVKKRESSEMRRNYEAFKGGRETEIEQKRNCRGFRNQKGRGVPPEWPSFALLAHQIAAFSFFSPTV